MGARGSRVKSDLEDLTGSEDIRVRKLQTATAVFMAARVIFAIGGAGFAIATIVVAVGQTPDVGIPAAIGVAGVGSLFGLAFALAMWFGIGWIVKSATGHAIRFFGPLVEHDSTGRMHDRIERASQSTNSGSSTNSGEYVPSLANIDFEIELTTAIAADGLEETLEFSAAILFTRGDLRGNVDLPVSARDGFWPDRLTQALLRYLKIGFEDRKTRLSPLAHEENDPDSQFSIMLSYSVTDLFGELDRPRLEKCIDKMAADPAVVSVYWDDRVLGTVRLVAAD